MQVMSRLFRETHHAPILENWGLLWMWHSVVLFGLCLATNWLTWQEVENRWLYLSVWAGGLAVWAPIFWWLRRRSGPVTFIERQIAHLWGAAVIGSVLLFAVEWLLDLPVLTLSPVLGAVGGDGVLRQGGDSGRGVLHPSGRAVCLTAGVMALWPLNSAIRSSASSRRPVSSCRAGSITGSGPRRTIRDSDTYRRSPLAATNGTQAALPPCTCRRSDIGFMIGTGHDGYAGRSSYVAKDDPAGPRCGGIYRRSAAWRLCLDRRGKTASQDAGADQAAPARQAQRAAQATGPGQAAAGRKDP